MLCGNSLNGGISAGRFCSLYTVSFKITSQPQFPDYPYLIYTRVKYSVEQLLQEDIIPQLVKVHGPLLTKVFPLNIVHFIALGVLSNLDASPIAHNLDVQVIYAFGSWNSQKQ
jgi:hypothetical protein